MKLHCFILTLSAVWASWIDVDTVPEHMKLKSFTDNLEYDLVMSDEFNRDGRSFEDGHDPMWTGVDKSDDDQTAQGRKSLHFYNASQIKTENGRLVITTTTEDTNWKGWNPYLKKYQTMSRHFKSGMLQSWNKFCFTGGILEVDVQFPGRHDVGGLWPAVWLMGNLGRATYEASTNLMWPWSYPKCNRDLQQAQEISGCDLTSHYGMTPGQGRGATEIDIIEVMPGPPGKLPIVKNNVQRPYTSMTLQVAPGIPAANKRPQPGTLPEWGFKWYQNLTYGLNVSINPFFYGTYLAATKSSEPISRSDAESYQCDAISSMMTIDESYFSTTKTFRLEWQPGENGYIHWYVDNKLRFGVEQSSLSLEHSQIPNEPSYVIMNTAISTSWGFPNPPFGCTDYDCKTAAGQCGFNPGFCHSLPAQFFIDHIRIYQNKNDSRHTLGCDPEEYPTKKWIEGHEYRYKLENDLHALKPIVTGGHRCKHDAECGEGSCEWWRCRCKTGWTGPKCLVPAYKNDFVDWDVDSWIVFSVPHVPGFLAVGGVALLVALVATTFLIARSKRSEQTVQPEYISVPGYGSQTDADL